MATLEIIFDHKLPFSIVQNSISTNHRRFGLHGAGGLLRFSHDLAALSGGFLFLTGTIILSCENF
jgi:hypothetical protein